MKHYLLAIAFATLSGNDSADGDFLHVNTSRTYTGQGDDLISHGQPQMNGLLIITVQILIDAVLLNDEYLATHSQEFIEFIHCQPLTSPTAKIRNIGKLEKDKKRMIFGKKIKELREEHGMVQRKLAAALDIDTPMYSKIERGERKAKRSHIPIMAKLLEINEKELLTIWLADKVLDTIDGEDEVKHDAVIFAQKEIEAEVG